MSSDNPSGQSTVDADPGPETEPRVSEQSSTDTPDDGSAETDPHSPVELTHAPPRVSQVVTGAGALIGTVLTVPFALLALPFGFSGLVLITAGVGYQHSRAWVTVGTGLVLVGALVTGAYGAVPTEIMLVAVSATFLAWDAGQHGIVIGEQLGRETRSRRKLLVHTGLSALVIGLVSMVAYASYLFSTGGRQASAAAVVVVGIVALVWLLRE